MSGHLISPGSIICYEGQMEKCKMNVRWSSRWNYCPYCGGEIDV